MFGFFTRKQKTPETRPSLTFHNTLTGTVDAFTPLRKGEVRMYNCGPTAYDYVQIGNLRSYVFADTLKRICKYNGYAVRQVINITDIGHLTDDADAGEDKMLKALDREGMARTRENMRTLADRYADIFKNDLAALNVDTTKTQFPHASDYIQGQIALISALTEKSYAYQIEDGIYFDTAIFKDYGKLGNISVSQLKEGARVTANTEKRNPADFALWKFNTEYGWDSPWGRGFPGWHIECSAMAYELLGKHIDIHTGGIDHIPTHHNNEIAQSESIFGAPFAQFWMHNAFVMVEGRKISKSLGNTITLRNIIEAGYSPLAYRYWLLSAHYATPINFTWDALDAANTALLRLHRHFVEQLGKKRGTPHAAYMERFTAAINDNVDTPKALALLWELEKDTAVPHPEKRATFLAMDAVLGLGFRDAHTRLQTETHKLTVDELPVAIKKKIEARDAARLERDFETADAIREEIRAAGYIVEDTASGPHITRTEG